jgi:cell division transport system permease protein
MIALRSRSLSRTARLPALAGDPARRIALWLIALPIYVAALAGIGLILVDDALRAAATQLDSRLTVQVPAQASAARLETILAVLRQTPGIRSVHLLGPEEIGRLLEPWLGVPVPPAELPLPRLIDAALDPAAALDRAKLGTQLAAVVPDIRIDDHDPALSGLRAAARPLRALLAALLAGALLLVVAASVFATDAALMARRGDIELLHLLGADERRIARPYAVRALWRGLLGGAVASMAILATIALPQGAFGAGRLIRLTLPSQGIGPGDWRLWAVLAAMVAAAGLVAAASARAAVSWRLARLP